MFIFPPMCQIYPQQLMSAIDFQFPNSVDVCYMFNALLPQRNVLHYRTVERSKNFFLGGGEDAIQGRALPDIMSGSKVRKFTKSGLSGNGTFSFPDAS